MLPVFDQTEQPDLDAPLNPEFPAPTALLRPFGAQFLLSRQGELTAASYSGNTAVGTPAGKGVRFAGGSSDGALFTSNRLLNRGLYSCAVKFRLEALGANQSLAAFNAGGALALRINTSDQLELLADSVAVLDVSTQTFRLGTIYTVVLTIYAGTTLVFVNGQLWIRFAGVRDLQATDQCYSLGRRGTGLSGQALTGSYIEAAFWNPDASLSPFGNVYNGLLSPKQAQELSCDYNQLFTYQAPQISSVSTGSGTTISATVGNAVAAGAQATISAGRTVAAGIGNAVANGKQASVSAGTTVNAGKGNAVAQGLPATIQTGGYINAGVGNAVAAGRTASISTGTTISCGVGAAQAIGWRASITNQQTYSVGYGDLSHVRKKVRKAARKRLVVVEAKVVEPTRPLAPLVIREDEILRPEPRRAAIIEPHWEAAPVPIPEPTIADVLSELRALRAELRDDRTARKKRTNLGLMLL